MSFIEHSDMTMRHWMREWLYRLLYMIGSRRQSVRVILLYHSVGNDTARSVPVPKFAQQMEWLLEHFQVVRLCDLPGAEKESIACVTFDDGYRDNYEVVLPVLERLGIRATFFITAGFLGKMFPAFDGSFPMMTSDQVKDLASQGHEIGAHTMTHPKLTKVSLEKAAAEIYNSRTFLEDLIGSKIDSFAYPKGLCNNAIKNLTQENGFRLAVTTRPGLVDDHPDWLMLPRVGISHNSSIGLFEAKLSHATPLYERIRRIGRQEL